MAGTRSAVYTTAEGALDIVPLHPRIHERLLNCLAAQVIKFPHRPTLFTIVAINLVNPTPAMTTSLIFLMISDLLFYDADGRNL